MFVESRWEIMKVVYGDCVTRKAKGAVNGKLWLPWPARWTFLPSHRLCTPPGARTKTFLLCLISTIPLRFPNLITLCICLNFHKNPTKTSSLFTLSCVRSVAFDNGTEVLFATLLSNYKPLFNLWHGENFVCRLINVNSQLVATTSGDKKFTLVTTENCLQFVAIMR